MPQRNRSQRLSGQYPLSYVGVNPVSPSNFIIDNRPPGPTDAQNFLIGDIWLDNSAYPAAPKAENVWMLVSLTGGVATWIDFAGGGDLKSLTGNVGGAVFGDAANNINTVGDNIGITVTGNPGTNTLTWSLVGGGGGVATQSFHTDDNNVEVPIGTAVIPAVGAVGQINVLGGATGANVYTNINTRQGVDIHTVDVDLNNSIGQPATNNTGTAGMYSLGGSGNIVLDRFMHNYGTHNTFLGNLSGNLTLNPAASQNNTCIGYITGNLLSTGNQNTCVGSTAGLDIDSSSNCTYVGYAAGIANNGAGNQNSGFGSQALNGVTTGARNSGFGGGCLFVTTGSDNCAIGQAAGSGYLSTESSNIIIGSQNFGTALESNTLRIGNASGAGAGNLNRAFIQGIYGVTPGGTTQTVICKTDGQLGTVPVMPNPFATTGFYAWSNGTMGASPFTLGAFSDVPNNNVGPNGFDLGGNFNTGTFTYTAPNTGYYWFNAMITVTATPGTITECTMAFNATPGGTFGPMSFNPANYQSGGPGTGMAFGGSWMTHLTAGDTVKVQVLFGGAGATPDVEGGTSRTFFQGYQIA